MAKIRRTPTQWQQIIQEQPQSGLTVQQYCLEQNISNSCFFKWRRKFAKETNDNNLAASPKDEKWLPLSKEMPSGDDWLLELSLPGGVVLKMKHA